MRTIAFATACYTVLVALVYLLVRWVENRPAHADVAPRPTMEFAFRYEIPPVKVVGGSLFA